jgi:hypothetical protein
MNGRRPGARGGPGYRGQQPGPAPNQTLTKVNTTHRSRRLRRLKTLEHALEHDARAVQAQLHAQGWDPTQARDGYAEWLHSLVDAALDRGWPT